MTDFTHKGNGHYSATISGLDVTVNTNSSGFELRAEDHRGRNMLNVDYRNGDPATRRSSSALSRQRIEAVVRTLIVSKVLPEDTRKALAHGLSPKHY